MASKAPNRLGRATRNFVETNPITRRLLFGGSTHGDAPLELRIDEHSLVANWRYLDSLSGGAATGAAVKANAYGLGAKRVVKALRAAGCRDFFVTYPTEAEELTDSGVGRGEVAFLHGTFTEADAAWAKAAGVRPVINSIQQAQRWLNVGGERCDLMVDTGINRLGISMSDLGHECIARLQIDVLHSHLASAEQETSLNGIQLKRWKQACNQVRHSRAALANSAGITLGPDYHGTLVRPGLSIYGGVPCAALEGRISQVARPFAAIMQVRKINTGEGIGYNSTYRAERPMRIGIVALGYADGYLRCWSDKGRFIWKSTSLPVRGRVSMDMTIIDLTDAPDCREGDWVEVEYEPVQAARVSGLSQYELFTLLGQRFARIYH